MSEFASKVALVTAAGAGIGRAIAEEFAKAGGRVVVSDFSLDQARAVAESIGPRAHAVRIDVRSAEDIHRGVAEAAAFGGGIDVLFNVAGVNVVRNVEQMNEEEWYRVMDTNLTSIYRICKLVVPMMRARGGGAIVNVSSAAGIMAENRCGAYSASKAGVNFLTRNMAMDFARDNIRVNAVCPGSTRTPRIEKLWKNSPTGKSEVAELSPMRRSAEPEEIARPAIFLASSGASYMTGAIVVVDGGLTAGIHVATFERM